MYYPECLPPILDFLDRIEMPFKAGPFGRDGFLPGIQIVNGVMLIDPDRLAGSGDVLHEAGHIVIVPSRWRSTLGDDVLATLEEVIAADRDAKDDPKLQTAIAIHEAQHLRAEIAQQHPGVGRRTHTDELHDA